MQVSMNIHIDWILIFVEVFIFRKFWTYLETHLRIYPESEEFYPVLGYTILLVVCAIFIGVFSR